jgi:hypothetical protein
MRPRYSAIFGVAELAADRLERGERALLVGAHQPRIPGDIGRQDRRQPALDPLSAHPPSRSQQTLLAV